MNTDIKLLTDEWIETQARKRKQVPIAVFAIIAVHVVLFLALLGSAGCKQSAEVTDDTTAKKMRDTEFQAAATQSAISETTAAKTPAPVQPEPVMAEPEVPSPQVKPETAAAKSKPVTLASASTDTTATIYVVKPGDSLGKIAKAKGTTAKALKQANGLKSDLIRVGQKLKVS